MQKGRARGPRLRWPPAYDEADPRYSAMKRTPDSRYDWSSQSRPASAPGRRYLSPQGPPSQHTVYRPDVAPELPDERAWSPPARGKLRDAPRPASAFRPPSPCGEAPRRPPPLPLPPREEKAPLGACRAPAAGREQRHRPRTPRGAAYSQPAGYHATVGGGNEAVPGPQQFSVNVLPPAWGRSRLAPALPPPRARTASAAPAPAPAPNPTAAAAAVAAAAAAAAAATARALAAAVAVAAAATPYVTEPPTRPSYDDEEEVDGEGEEEEEDLRDQLIEEIEHCTIREELDSEGVPVARTRRTVREQVFRVHDPSRRQRRPSNSTSTAASSASSSKPSSWSAAFSRPQCSSMSIAITPSASPSSKSLRFVVDVSPKKDPDRIMNIDSINSSGSGLSAAASQMLGALGSGSGARACGGAAARARARLPGRVAVRLGAVRAALGRLGAEVERAPAASAAAISAAAGDASALYLRLQRAREEAAQVARALDLFRAKIYQTSAAAESAGEAVSARARALVHEMTLRLTEVERDVRDQALRCHAAQQQMKETPPPPVSEPPVTIQSSFLIPEVDFSSEDVFNAEEVSQFLDKVLERLHSVVKLASI